MSEETKPFMTLNHLRQVARPVLERHNCDEKVIDAVANLMFGSVNMAYELGHADGSRGERVHDHERASCQPPPSNP